jgi:hypothetical protein
VHTVLNILRFYYYCLVDTSAGGLRLDFYVFVTITWSIPLLVDYRHHVYDPPKSGEMVIVTVPITLTEAVNLPAMFYLPVF